MNYFSMYENSALKVFKKQNFYVNYLNNLPKDLPGTNVYKTLQSSW